MIIGIAGLRQSGKDTVAKELNHIYGYNIYHIATPLKHAAELLGWNGTKDNSEFGRPFLEWLGMDVFKSKFGRDYFIKMFYKSKKFHEDENVVIPDIRDAEEAQYIQANGGKVVLIERTHPDYLEEIKAHPSISDERLKLIVPDQIIINDGNLIDLKQKVPEIIPVDLREKIHCEFCLNKPQFIFVVGDTLLDESQSYIDAHRFYACSYHYDTVHAKALDVFKKDLWNNVMQIFQPFL